MKGVVEDKIPIVEELSRKDEEVFITNSREARTDRFHTSPPGWETTLRYSQQTVNSSDKKKVKIPQKASRKTAFSSLNVFHRILVLRFMGHKVHRVPNFPLGLNLKKR